MPLSTREFKNLVTRDAKSVGLFTYEVVQSLPVAGAELEWQILGVRKVPGTSSADLYMCLGDDGATTTYSWVKIADGDGSNKNHTHTSSIVVNAGGMVSPGTNGAADGVTDGTNFSYATKDFDTTTEEHADFGFTIPSNYGGGNITVTFSWTAASGSGTVSWEMNVRNLTNDEILDGAATDVGSATDTLLTAGDLHQVSLTWSSTLPTAGDYILVRVSRDVAADTLGVDAKLLEVTMSWEF